VHAQYRLFLTMEFNPKVPSTLIKQSLKIIYEQPSGIKTSLFRSFGGLIHQPQQHKIALKLNFLLFWFHAVAIERLRYTPVGYSKHYEFNEAD